MIKNQKGITLVALVVTVIVLIILAAVTIQLVVGNNGIIKKTNEAVLDNRGAAIQERIKLWETEKVMGAKTKKGTELLEELETEGLLKAEEREALKNIGEVFIGSKKVTIDLSYSLDLIIKPPMLTNKLISFYSSDGGVTWTEMAQNELHLNSFKNDILIYMFVDVSWTTSFWVYNELTVMYPASDSPTIPIADTSGFSKTRQGSFKITATDDYDLLWLVSLYD